VSEINTFVLNPSVPILIVICGPTATGKSGLALALAQRLPGIILSADSRQVYREFDLGTAKPSLTERQQVPHYLVDICQPTETLTLAEYQQQAQALIAEFHAALKPNSQAASDLTPDLYFQSSTANPQPPIPLLVGGTGLYIRSIVRGLQIPKVAPQLNLRSQLQSLGQPLCYGFLSQVDPTSARKIHPNDQVRTLRALEVFYATGQPISQQQGEHPPAYPVLQLGLDCTSSEALLDRIERRTAEMIAAGFAAEVDMLCQKYGAGLPLLNTLGYQEMKQYLAGEISLSEAEALIVLHTRQFAKQQRTWLHADPQIEWFDADAPDLQELVWKRIQQFLLAHSREALYR
jgi:tRNA dimethylallyltransferase